MSNRIDGLFELCKQQPFNVDEIKIYIKENQLFYTTYFKLCYDESHKISVYDPAMKNTPGMAARVFSAIASSDADIRLITTSEVEISLLVTEADYDTVLTAIEEAVN